MKKGLLLLLILFALSGCRQRMAMSPDVLVIACDASASVQATDDRQQQAAVLSDTRDIYRVCTTRPQRVLPSQGSNTQRTPGKLPVALRHLHGLTPKHAYGRRARTETAPFCFVASRDYYVIALRHILC
jgi:hypothetical protein